VDCFQTRVNLECDGEKIELISASNTEDPEIKETEQETAFFYNFPIKKSTGTKIAEIKHECKLRNDSPILFCKAIFTPISKSIKDLKIISVMKPHTDNSAFTRTTFSVDGKINFHDSYNPTDGKVKEVIVKGNVDFTTVSEMFDMAYRYGLFLSFLRKIK
jgi:hypothetical protein